MKKTITALLLLAVLAGLCPYTAAESNTGGELEPTKDFVKWVDFNVPCEALKKAAALDIESHESGGTHYNWIELLSYLAAKNGNNFKNYKNSQLTDLIKKLDSGKTMAELTADMKYYPYYLETLSAVLAGFIGEYEIEVPDEDDSSCTHRETRYGVKVFSPIAKNFPYSHYDDFGTKRTYGFSRPHLGNDLMGQVGTPITAVEGGTIEALGWNRYGGWRIGIRSADSMRYYYYAHLRKGFPYRKDLEIGDTVQAGDVIGYLGRTGYSTKEDTNNIKTAHLHFGMQLIFDESQKESDNEIWIDVYEIVRFLDRYRSETVKNPETKDYHRVYEFKSL